MWGNLFNVETKPKSDHSVGCRMIGDKIILMSDLDVLLQEHVLSCPHSSHDVVKQIFMIPYQGEPSKEPIEEGRLF